MLKYKFILFKRSLGFTLVELLVVIVIISVISGIGIASYTGYVRDSRDSSRKASLMQIKGYLDQYYSANFKYPDCPNGCSPSTQERVWIPGLEPYASFLPVDPENSNLDPYEGGHSFLYKSYNNGQSYDLTGLLENPNDVFRCEVIKYRGGESDNTLLCDESDFANIPYLKRIIEVSKGLSAIPQTESQTPNPPTPDPSINILVETLDATSIIQTGAFLKGKLTITNNPGNLTVDYKKICFSQNQNLQPSTCIDNSMTDTNNEFGTIVGGLQPATTYYFRPVVSINSTIYNGQSIKSFRTLGSPEPETPLSLSLSSLDITQNSVLLKTTISGQRSYYSARSKILCLQSNSNFSNINLTSNPSCRQADTTSSMSDFSLPFTNLTPNSIYYALAFMSVDFGNNIVSNFSSPVTTFQTQVSNNQVTVITGDATSITANSAVLSASVSSNNPNIQISEKKICYRYEDENELSTPECRTTNNQGLGDFSINALNLIPDGTVYFYQAFVTANGVEYSGAVKEFVTGSSPVTITVTTVGSSEVRSNSAKLEGSTSGNTSLKGICLSQSPTIPTYTNNSQNNVECKSTVANSSNFLFLFENLAPQTTYNFRAFALQSGSDELVYGETKSFTTYGSNIVDYPIPEFLKKRVLVVVYDPKDSSGQLVRDRFGWNASNPYEDNAKIASYIKEATNEFVQYEIINIVRLNKLPPYRVSGSLVEYNVEDFIDCAETRGSSSRCMRVYNSYADIVSDPSIQACRKFNRGEIDELWVWGGPYMGAWESHLIGPSPEVYWYNSSPTITTEQVWGEDHCKKPLIVMGYSYERNAITAVHNFTHRAESAVSEAFRSKFGATEMWSSYLKADGSKNPYYVEGTSLWNRFANPGTRVLDTASDYGSGNNMAGCGNGHYTPLTKTNQHEYRYNPFPTDSIGRMNSCTSEQRTFVFSNCYKFKDFRPNNVSLLNSSEKILANKPERPLQNNEQLPWMKFTRTIQQVGNEMCYALESNPEIDYYKWWFQRMPQVNETYSLSWKVGVNLNNSVVVKDVMRKILGNWYLYIFDNEWRQSIYGLAEYRSGCEVTPTPAVCND